MAHYLDPKNDLTFKRLFGEHKHLCMDFLNAVMPLSRPIEEIEYLSPEQVPDSPTKKYSIVDVKCRDGKGRQFIIEMQMFWTAGFYNRIVFNAGKAYVRQLDRNEEYHLLQPVYTLALLNYKFDRITDKFYHHYQIVNKANTEEIIPGLEFVLIELEKFRPETMSDRRLMVLWLRFLNEVGEDMKSLPPELQENEHIRQAAELCEEGAFTPEEREAYDHYWDVIRTEKTSREGARREGLAEGLAKGEAKGLAKGLKKGEEKGLALGLKKGEAERAKLEAERAKLAARIAELERKISK